MATEIKTLELKVLAQSEYLAYSDQQRAIVKFGMIPAETASKFEALGFNAREIALAMFDATKTDGGMVA